MLMRLTKNEIASTSKIYLPLYGILLVLAVLNRVLLSMNSNNFNAPQGFAMMGYVMVMTAIWVVTLVLGISRFQKNLLGDEGYLMHTLPVRKWQLIASKLIAACTWTILAAIVGFVSLMILAFEPEVFNAMGHFFRELFQILGQISAWDIFVTIFYAIVFIILGLAAMYLPFYLAMALGNMSNKNKTLASIGCFLAISFGWQFITVNIGMLLDKIDITRFLGDMSVSASMHLGVWSVILYFLIFNAVCFFGTNWALSKKLNLQ